jgi:PilZ domain
MPRVTPGGSVLRKTRPSTDHLIVEADRTRALTVAGSRPIRVGGLARVECADGEVWSGRVSYVSGELVGLKSSTIVPTRVAAGDTVTVVVGTGESMVAAEARVLAASGSFMRLSRRESTEGLERRRALRVPVHQTVKVVSAETRSDPGRTFAAELTDMSASGCAIRAGQALAIGHPIAISLRIVGTDLTLSGKVVRVWRSDEGEHAGMQLDPVPASTTSLINRYLVEQLRATSTPGSGCARRTPTA